MKKTKRIVACIAGVALGATALVGFAGCGKKDGPVSDYDTSDIAGTYKVKIWNSEVSGVSALTQTQIERFNAENKFGIVIEPTIEGVTEAEAATSMLTSVEDGADMFFFAQDQTMRLMQAGALTKLGKAASAEITERNDASAVGAATVGDSLYCYPVTSDNGYFMFYDKSVVSEEHVDDLAAIIADCEAAGRMFSYELETSAWYNAGFFFATGCHSTWTTNNDGAFTAVYDNFNSDAGVIALRGMQQLLQSKAYLSSSSTADFAAATPSAVVVSGTWGASTAKEALGDNYGVTDLPSFTVDGNSYHLGSYSGNKLLGIKPQTDTKRAAALQQLALYLSNTECQLERFNNFGWGPSNKEAQADEAVKADATLAALAKQNEYAVPQGQIHGSWWDIAKVYAASAKAAAKDDTAALQAAVKTYDDSIKALFSMSDAEKNAWTVIGSINGDSWSLDLPMTEIQTGIWQTNEAYDLKEGDEFKCRKGKNWDDAVPADNYKVETAGKYYIKVNVVSGDIELVAA